MPGIPLTPGMEADGMIPTGIAIVIMDHIGAGIAIIMVVPGIGIISLVLISDSVTLANEFYLHRILAHDPLKDVLDGMI